MIKHILNVIVRYEIFCAKHIKYMNSSGYLDWNKPWASYPDELTDFVGSSFMFANTFRCSLVQNMLLGLLEHNKRCIIFWKEHAEISKNQLTHTADSTREHQMENYALLISGCPFILLWARTVHKSVFKRPQTSGCRRLKQLRQHTSRASACTSHTGGAGSCDNFSAVRHNFLWWLNQPARKN